jgi:hypothetical protein
VNHRGLREALDRVAPYLGDDADAVLVEAKPRFRRARRRRRIKVVAGLAAGGVVAAGALTLAGVLLDDSAATPAPAVPADGTNPPLTTGAPVPFTLDENE